MVDKQWRHCIKTAPSPGKQQENGLQTPVHPAPPKTLFLIQHLTPLGKPHTHTHTHPILWDTVAP